ncbi:hypothetical protein ACJX0J_041808, partial [Zea mays]
VQVQQGRGRRAAGEPGPLRRLQRHAASPTARRRRLPLRVRPHRALLLHQPQRGAVQGRRAARRRRPRRPRRRRRRRRRRRHAPSSSPPPVATPAPSALPTLPPPP